MAFNPSPKVADCREIARKWDCIQTIVIGITASGKMSMATYGATKELCAEAKEYGDAAFDAVVKRAEVPW